MHICTCTTYVPGAHSQERDSLELKLQMIVSCCVGAGNRNPVLWKDKKCSYVLSHCPTPYESFKCIHLFIVLKIEPRVSPMLDFAIELHPIWG